MLCVKEKTPIYQMQIQQMILETSEGEKRSKKHIVVPNKKILIIITSSMEHAMIVCEIKQHIYYLFRNVVES